MTTMVVIPTYNERENIKALIPKILELPVEGPIEILVVDDNSPDGTGRLVEEMGAQDPRIHVMHRPAKLGLGTAYIAGFKEALTRSDVDYIIEMDADFSHNPEVIPKFLAAMKYHDVVVGSRYITGVSVINWPLSRLLLSWFANAYARRVTGLTHLTDITTGFKCFSRKVLETIPLDKVHAVGYAFQIEMNFRAFRLGFNVGEVPIIFVDRHAGHSKMNRSLVREALLIVWKFRLGLYDR